ncbi:MAG: hypothetical protein FWD63_02265 [Propionibacteriaceae bacterium]|nr:hypothetical protein [Propionibacteriaceae bacterium]
MAIVLLVLAALTACSTTRPVVTPSVSSTPSSSATPGALPTVRGAAGPLGVVQVNQTFYYDTIGLRVTVSEATTAKLSGETVRSGWGNTYSQVFAMRVAVDTTEAAARNLGLNFDSELGNSGFSVYSKDYSSDATCLTLTYQFDAAEQAHALEAIGGDVAFNFDATTDTGEGWVVCPIVVSDNADYMDGYTVHFRGASGHDSNGSLIGIGPQLLLVVEP